MTLEPSAAVLSVIQWRPRSPISLLNRVKIANLDVAKGRGHEKVG